MDRKRSEGLGQKENGENYGEYGQNCVKEEVERKGEEWKTWFENF